MKKIRILFLGLLLVAAPAFAAPPSEETLQRLLTVTRAESMIDSIYASVEEFMQQTVRQSTAGVRLTPAQQRVYDGVMRKTMALLREEISWAKTMPMYLQIYRETFTQEEVEALIAFYESPAGQAFVTKMPTIVQKSMAYSQAKMQSFMPKIKAILDEATAEAKAAR